MRKEPCSSTAEDERLERLLEHLGRLLPDPRDRDEFKSSASSSAPPHLRINTLAPQAGFLRAALHDLGEGASWCPDSVVVDSAPPLGHTLEYALGAIYIQAKAATLAVEALNPRPGERVLDMAASPGGKATQIAAHMKNSGLLIANEPRRKRIHGLVGNLQRLGVANAIVTQLEGTLLARYFHNFFDRVLLDAPCSCDGIFRKDSSMLRYWSVEDARRIAQKQTGLLRAAFHMLRPGGTLVYSTCSLSLEENEEVLLGLCRRFADKWELLPVEGIETLPLPPVIAGEFPAEFQRCVRVWPHRYDTEGAFVARIGKTADTYWKPAVPQDSIWDLETADPSPEVLQGRQLIADQWQLELPQPAGLRFAMDGRYLWLLPAPSPGSKERFPFHIRGGMHVARKHRDHFYLTQQTITMWGDRIRQPRVELTWPQVQDIFRGVAVRPSSLPDAGEFVCGFGPWTICRGHRGPDGSTIEAMLPKELMRPELHRIS
jgi:16S rRNA (cytosine1407-C5)-methyltransferase